MIDDLDERFERLRHEDARGAPLFRATLAAAERRRARGSGGRLRVVIGALAAMAVLALGLRILRSPTSRGALVDLTATRWQAPTDFLLRIPGVELLRTLPRLDFDWRFM